MSLIESPPLAGAALHNIDRSAWTNEREAMLRELWLADELTARAIADEIGGFEYCFDGGKNAVIGKARRLGLKAHAKNAGRPRGPARPAKPKAKTRHVVTYLQKRKAEALEGPAVDLPPEAELFIPLAQRCTLLELTDDACRFPIGDPGTPEFAFCGGMARHGAPYCAGHMRICYAPPPVRRDRMPSRA